MSGFVGDGSRERKGGGLCQRNRLMGHRLTKSLQRLPQAPTRGRNVARMDSKAESKATGVWLQHRSSMVEKGGKRRRVGGLGGWVSTAGRAHLAEMCCCKFLTAQDARVGCRVTFSLLASHPTACVGIDLVGLPPHQSCVVVQRGWRTKRSGLPVRQQPGTRRSRIYAVYPLRGTPSLPLTRPPRSHNTTTLGGGSPSVAHVLCAGFCVFVGLVMSLPPYQSCVVV